MNGLDIEDLSQLVNFYKQKANDLEFQFLQMQIKLNKVIASKNVSTVEDKPTIDKKSK